MLERAHVKTLPELFHKRVAQTPKQIAFQFFDESAANWRSITWRDLYKKSLSYRHALASEKLEKGSRVLLILENNIDWICLEQATLSLGLIVVAASPMDSLQSIRHIVQDCDPALLFVTSDRFLESLQLTNKRCIVQDKLLPHSNVIELKQWITDNERFPSQPANSLRASDVASIIYNSGTNGKAKGVMLSHEAIINNAQACRENMLIMESDTLLNVTPLSHILSRVLDYYTAMLVGVPVVFNKALGKIDESVKKTHPTLMTCTPYILECAYSELLKRYPRLKNYIESYIDYKNGITGWKLSFLFWNMTRRSLQKNIRQNFLFSLRAIYTSGSLLSNKTRSLASILGLPIYQGYSRTEAGGVIAFNTPADNKPRSVGKVFDAESIKLTGDGSLLLKNDSLMLGYWKDTYLETILDEQGWLKTSDQGRMENGFLTLANPQSSVIQLANGHCVFPEPIENRLKDDSIFENVLIYGQDKVKLTAICQIATEKWQEFASNYNVTSTNQERLQGILFTRINALLQTVPNSPRIDYILPTFDNWTDEGFINAQGKVDRLLVETHYANQLDEIYQQQYPFRSRR